MSILVPSWRPKKRSVYYAEKPDWVPEWVYVEAVTAKRYYNEEWEFWVWRVSQDHNCPLSEAEDACIRGVKKALLQVQLVYGDKIGRWFEEYLDMKDLFSKVSHPIYLPKLS